jgi:hypothetical protein
MLPGLDRGIAKLSFEEKNATSSLSRTAWITVTGICVIAALLLLINGYDGYSAVLLFVGVSAAVNLLP